MVLFSRMGAPKWGAYEDPYREAKCRKLPIPRYKADPFFDDEEYALRVCNGLDADAEYENAGQICPMRHECLIFALKNHEGAGIWGGMLTHDRMTIKRHMPREWWHWHPPTERADEASAPLAA